MSHDRIPKNPEIESEALALIFQNPAKDYAQRLLPVHFTYPRDAIFAAMRELGDGLTPARLRDELAKRGELKPGIDKALAEIYAADPLPDGIFESHRSTLEDQAARRRGLSLAQQIEREAGDETREFRLSDKAKALLASDGVAPFSRHLEASAMRGDDFLSREFPQRPALVGDWFRCADLGFVFAPRGVGKTWFVYMLISSLTSGRDLGPWHVPEVARVCLLDGEMPADAVQDRLKGLSTVGENLTILSHQFLYDLCGRGFQLSDQEQRDALLDYCRRNEIRVLVMDNLSSISTVSENDNDEWMLLGEWLLDFRRQGIAVVIVHHAGRNGNMRGASRREDPAFWVIRLDDSKERTETADGARFVSTFTKARNCRSTPSPLDWHIIEEENGSSFRVEFEPAGTDELVLQCIKDGLDRCSDIATELEISKGTVSKAANRLESTGRISISGKGNQGRYEAN